MLVHEVHSGVNMYVHPKRVIAVIENTFIVHKGTKAEKKENGTIIFVEGLDPDKPMVVKETYDEVMKLMGGKE